MQDAVRGTNSADTRKRPRLKTVSALQSFDADPYAPLSTPDLSVSGYQPYQTTSDLIEQQQLEAQRLRLESERLDYQRKESARRMRQSQIDSLEMQVSNLQTLQQQALASAAQAEQSAILNTNAKGAAGWIALGGSLASSYNANQQRSIARQYEIQIQSLRMRISQLRNTVDY